jgi:hypothetical protein
MTIAPSADDESFRTVVNTGPGTVIGRDNYGTINSPIDDTTKKILAKLATEAPDLARVVRTALDKGIVPPGLVYALERAAWAINEDVAVMLQGAARNINEDVAIQLGYAANQIKEGADTTARLLGSGTSDFRSLVERLERACASLTEVQQAYVGYGVIHQLSQVAEEIKHRADVIEGAVEPPPAQIIVNWRPTFWAFITGIIVGMVILAVITR